MLLIRTVVFAAFACSSALPAQLTTLFAATSSTQAGRYCTPIDCTPDPLDVRSGDTLFVEVGGGFPGEAALLLVSLPPAGCISLPGFTQSLIVQPAPLMLPFTPTTATRLYIDFGPIANPPTCAHWLNGDSVTLPNLPAGTQFVVQALRAYAPTFSNALLLTFR